jgi:uncharacterized membrane protein YfcA
MSPFLLLFGAGLLAGAMNALAGGGSFVTLPTLLAAGVPSVQANASSTVALWPGGAASAWTYYAGTPPLCGVPLQAMLMATLAGGLVGSVLLLWTSSSAFNAVLPWLMLMATMALAFGRQVGARLQGRIPARAALVLTGQFGLGIYGGYFGGAVGLMMMAVWCLLGEGDVKALNGPRTLLVTATNTVAVLTFMLAGAVRWPQTLAMLAGGLVGGVFGARLGRIVPAGATRTMTLCFTLSITVLFFVRAYASALWP